MFINVPTEFRRPHGRADRTGNAACENSTVP
jgi:hypothetical protein